MLRQHFWIGAVALGLMAGCDKKERNVDVSPARPAEPSVDTRSNGMPATDTAGTDRTGTNDSMRGTDTTAPRGTLDDTRPSTDTAHATGTNDSMRGTDMNSGSDTTANDKAVGLAAGAMTPSTALNAIAQARCSREARCKNIGADKKYKTVAECTSKMVEDKKDDLNLSDCPRGINQKGLRECLRSVTKEDCNNPLDSLSRLTACRSSDLCMSSK